MKKSLMENFIFCACVFTKSLVLIQKTSVTSRWIIDMSVCKTSFFGKFLNDVKILEILARIKILGKLQVLETPLGLLPFKCFDLCRYVVVSEIKYGERSIPNVYYD